jgi:alpha-amylase
MGTKTASDGQVHKYFSPYDSPYDAYMAFMHVVSDLEGRLSASAASGAPVSAVRERSAGEAG